ncbi:MAG: permease [Candidatus Lokiarchaeota archaeon]|nr:permease [Candidatus Lokiarchaeota archaeon]
MAVSDTMHERRISLKKRFLNYFNAERRKKLYTIFYFIVLAALVGYFIYSKIKLLFTTPPTESIDYAAYEWYIIPYVYIINYIKHAWNSLLLAFMLSGVIYEFVPTTSIRKWLGGGKFYHYLLAALLAPIFVTCSCSVIPVYVGILASGASLGVAMTFFLMAPAANFITILMTGEYIGWNLGLWRLAWSFVAAVLSGILFDRLRVSRELRNQYDKQYATTGQVKRFEVKKTIHDRVETAYKFTLDIMKNILPRLLLGLVAVSFLIAYIPDEWITTYFTGFVGIVIAALLGGPLYTPTLVEIVMTRSFILKGMDNATALSFMMGQPYDFVSMVPNSKYFKWKGVLLYSIVSFVISILSAVVYALIYKIPL